MYVSTKIIILITGGQSLIISINYFWHSLFIIFVLFYWSLSYILFKGSSFLGITLGLMENKKVRVINQTNIHTPIKIILHEHPYIPTSFFFVFSRNWKEGKLWTEDKEKKKKETEKEKNKDKNSLERSVEMLIRAVTSLFSSSSLLLITLCHHYRLISIHIHIQIPMYI